MSLVATCQCFHSYTGIPLEDPPTRRRESKTHEQTEKEREREMHMRGQTHTHKDTHDAKSARAHAHARTHLRTYIPCMSVRDMTLHWIVHLPTSQTGPVSRTSFTLQGAFFEQSNLRLRLNDTFGGGGGARVRRIEVSVSAQSKALRACASMTSMMANVTRKQSSFTQLPQQASSTMRGCTFCPLQVKGHHPNSRHTHRFLDVSARGLSVRVQEVGEDVSTRGFRDGGSRPKRNLWYKDVQGGRGVEFRAEGLKMLGV